MCFVNARRSSDTAVDIQPKSLVAYEDDSRECSNTEEYEEGTDPKLLQHHKHRAAAFTRVLEDQSLNTVVTVVAAPGCGKSTACHHIRVLLSNEGYNVVLLKETVSTLEENVKMMRKYIKMGEIWYRLLFQMLLLINLINKIIANITCKQTSCKKYPCLNSILFRIWQSGDVQVNPGPPKWKSVRYRNWLYDACSFVRKAIAGVSPNCKMKHIWQQPPENWPQGILYCDPRNSKEMSVCDVGDFLQTLVKCCDDTSMLSHEIHSEIDTWNSYRSKENDKLLKLYESRMCRRSSDQVNISVKILQNYLQADEVLEFEMDNGLHIILSRQSATDKQFLMPKLFKAESTREMASFLCRILHGKSPDEKCDNIWNETPVGWPSDCRFYNPNNGGKRRAENEDARVLRELITLCESNSLILSKQFQDMVDAWRADDQTLLSKLITRHTAETDLKSSLRDLHEGGLLRDLEFVEYLNELGLLVQRDKHFQNTQTQKRKTVCTTTKSQAKRTRKQYDHEETMNATLKELFPGCHNNEEAVDATLKELLPGCSIIELLDNRSDCSLLDMISQKVPDVFLEDAANDIQL